MARKMSSTEKWICRASVIWWVVCFLLSIKFGFGWFCAAYAGLFVGLSVLFNVIFNNSKSK